MLIENLTGINYGKQRERERGRGRGKERAGREVAICIGYEQEVSKVREICTICMGGNGVYMYVYVSTIERTLGDCCQANVTR